MKCTGRADWHHAIKWLLLNDLLTRGFSVCPLGETALCTRREVVEDVEDVEVIRSREHVDRPDVLDDPGLTAFDTSTYCSRT